MSESYGKICSAQDLITEAQSDQVQLVCLSRGQSIGLSLVAETGLLSLIAVVFVFLLIFRKVLQTGKLIQYPTDVYMLSLFAFDILQALGRITHIKWINEGKLYVGGYCTAQGVIQQLGETGVAMATLAIAAHTFMVVMWGRFRYQIAVAYLVTGVIWLFIILFVAITTGIHTKGPDHYMTPDGYWCWIGDGPTHYKKERIAGEYFWLLFTMFASILAYIPLFFWARGNLSVSTQHWWKFSIHRKTNVQGDDADGRKRRALGMIAYPLAYAIMVLPEVVCRLITHFGSESEGFPSAATFAVQILFSLSGAVNALLFIITRSELLGLGNKSAKQHRLGIAPGVTLSESKTMASDTDSTRLRVGRHPQEQSGATGFLPGPDDGDWAPPTLENGSRESVGR